MCIYNFPHSCYIFPIHLSLITLILLDGEQKLWTCTGAFLLHDLQQRSYTGFPPTQLVYFLHGICLISCCCYVLVCAKGVSVTCCKSTVVLKFSFWRYSVSLCWLYSVLSQFSSYLYRFKLFLLLVFVFLQITVIFIFTWKAVIL
jgi:hypothetical protein